jgi:hypothetical protein
MFNTRKSGGMVVVYNIWPVEFVRLFQIPVSSVSPLQAAEIFKALSSGLNVIVHMNRVAATTG